MPRGYRYGCGGVRGNPNPRTGVGLYRAESVESSRVSRQEACNGQAALPTPQGSWNRKDARSASWRRRSYRGHRGRRVYARCKGPLVYVRTS